MLSLLFISLAASADIKYYPSANRSVSSVPSEKEAHEVFGKFHACVSEAGGESESRERFLSCTDQYVNPDLRRASRDKLASWLLLDFVVKSFGVCERSQLDFARELPSFNKIVLCMQLESKAGSKMKAMIFFKSKDSQIYLHDIIYDH